VHKNNSGIIAGSDYGNDPDDWSNLPHDPSEDGVNYPDVAESTTREGGISKPPDTNDNNPAVTDNPGDDEENTTKTTKKPRKKITKKPTKKKKKRPIYRQPPIRPEVVPVPVPQLPEPRRPRITGPGCQRAKITSPTRRIAYRAGDHAAALGQTMWTSVHVITVRGTKTAVTPS
jgi:hypothetical protein